MATLSKKRYWDRVYACWLGKNCGGTLGAPLERGIGEEEPFSIDWYPELREGGIPNDDLEMQLIWLKAIEEKGFDITSRHLAQYWLDHIGYNWDEYGLNKTNLRLGLRPPVSGYYNNWFRDCMGSPIRSEIWACLAPGCPELAVRYAFEDASVDHAGGEGVWGEVFNAAVESAAFVESNPQTLLDIGLSYIPPMSATARTIKAARAAHAAGVDWKEARRQVMAAAPHYVAQYSPINLGFQVVGWLYGTDFGDTLCLTVNCGYDTDCTGATVGSLLGILGGRAGLPEKWTAPLGEGISTNESWGGLRGTSTGANPVPTTLAELTDRVCRQGARLLALRGAPVQIGDSTDVSDFPLSSLYCSARTQQELVGASPLRLTQETDALSLTLDYGDSPVIVPGTPRDLHVTVQNRRASELTVEILFRCPAGWSVGAEGPESFTIPAGEAQVLPVHVQVDDPASVHNSNAAYLRVQPQGRPTEAAIPLVFVGARRWLISAGQDIEPGMSADTLLDQPGTPEQDLMIATPANQSLPVGWQIASAPDNALPAVLGTDWTGTRYARLYLRSPREQEVQLGIPGTCPRKIWLNGRPLHETLKRGPLRPNYDGDKASYASATLRKGWNDVLIKYARDAAAPPFAAHFILTTAGLHHGIHDVEWTQFPWDAQR